MYDPNFDVNKVAEYFKKKYGDLDTARKRFDPEAEFDLCTFEAVLRKWGVEVENVVELFGLIDLDCNGTVSMFELLLVLELPMQEAKAREEQRLKNEVIKIYEQIAKNILSKYGTVADYFAKVQLKGLGFEGQKDLSLARFGQLLRDLNIDLEATKAHRAFNDIDTNGSGTISMKELQEALNFSLVRYALADLANFLVERHGSATKPFEHVEEVLGRLPNERKMSLLMSPDTPAQLAPPAIPSNTSEPNSSSEMTWANFRGMLRRLEVIDKLKEDTAKELYDNLKPFSLDKFVQHMNTTEAELAAAEKREKEEKKKQLEHEKRAATLLNSRKRAEQDVEKWENRMKDPLVLQSAFEDVKGSEALGIENVTRNWSTCARAGRANAQLQDFMGLLEEKAQKMEIDNEVERNRLRKVCGEMEGNFEISPVSAGTPFSPLASPTSLAAGSQLSTRGGGLVPQEVKITRIERLIQAAAANDVTSIQNILALKTDPNSAGWGGVTPLMAAARHGQQVALECLIARQGDLMRTDMRGRTAVDHAYKQHAIRGWLRACGGRTGRELVAEAEKLAHRVLVAGSEAARLAKTRDRLPSAEVQRQARLLRQMSDFGMPLPSGPCVPPWPSAFSPVETESPKSAKAQESWATAMPPPVDFARFQASMPSCRGPRSIPPQPKPLPCAIPRIP